MRKALIVPFLLLLFVQPPARAQAPSFAEFFTGDAMRLDLYQVGNAKEEAVTLDQVYREGAWPGSRRVLLDPFGYGRYAVKVYDAASNRLIYSQGFDCMFGEYKTTRPALDGVTRVCMVQGFVNAAPEFGEHPAVMNGASDLFVQVTAGNGLTREVKQLIQ